MNFFDTIENNFNIIISKVSVSVSAKHTVIEFYDISRNIDHTVFGIQAKADRGHFHFKMLFDNGTFDCFSFSSVNIENITINILNDAKAFVSKRYFKDILLEIKWVLNVLMLI